LQEIRPLTSLRGLAALYVVAYHASDAAGVNDAPHGYLAVDLFFVLSGFVLALTAARDFASRGWLASGGFWARRVARIMPLNLFVVGAIVTANVLAHGGTGAPPARVACNALALQGFGTCVSLNAPAWTLSFEWLAYALFPLILGAVLLSPLALCAASVTGAVLALIVMTVTSGRATLDSSQFGPAWSAIRCVGEMVLGVAAYRAYAAPRVRAALSSDTVLGLAVIASAAGCIFGERVAACWIGGDVWAVAAFPVLILCLASNNGRLGRALGWAPLHALGVISFSIYLLHDPILQRETRLMAAWRPDWTAQGAATCMFVLLAPVSVIPLAWLSRRLIEVPGRRAVRWLLLHRTAPVPGG
jgi:peptidoglycan/LPS O-acetylase OafA/YrhL